jgi:hypothetical protein
MSSRIVIDPLGDILLQIPSCPAPPTPIPLPLPAEASDSVEKDDDNSSVSAKSQAADVKSTRELLVSSKVLSVASPVFKAMLNGRFLEGIELSKAKTSAEPYLAQLPLPEDDAEAMTLLCKLLHFDIDDIPERPNPQSLENLAFACDKYGCISPLRYSGGTWIRNWLLHYENTEPIIDDVCRLFILAYVADLEFEFLEVAWTLLLYHKGPFQGPHTQAVIFIDHPLLHESVRSKSLTS